MSKQRTILSASIGHDVTRAMHVLRSNSDTATVGRFTTAVLRFDRVATPGASDLDFCHLFAEEVRADREEPLQSTRLTPWFSLRGLPARQPCAFDGPMFQHPLALPVGEPVEGDGPVAADRTANAPEGGRGVSGPARSPAASP
ncbi:MAG: hypothetical protein KGJ62_01405 [Armatimonadetes bacterium]|nr:hypothetical protein [Armatimonadota bacterium]MDE2205838.1 hypothetical protein [Armatimonadota bacterium]